MSYKTIILTIFLLTALSCENLKNHKAETIKSFNLDNIDEIITKDGVEIDRDVTSDGNGSVKITTENPVSVQLFKTGDIDIEDSVLVYAAKLRTEDLDGIAYIEMWCSFPGKGIYFSKALNSALSGTNDWTIQEVPFFLKKGENPDNVELNLVINGRGKVWIDQVELLKRPIK